MFTNSVPAKLDFHFQINDDEAERRNSRRMEESFSDSSKILVEDTDSLNMCLQMHSENVSSQLCLFYCTS